MTSTSRVPKGSASWPTEFLTDATRPKGHAPGSLARTGTDGQLPGHHRHRAWDVHGGPTESGLPIYDAVDPTC